MNLNILNQSLIYFNIFPKIEFNSMYLFNLCFVFQSSGKIEKAKKIYLKMGSLIKDILIL